MTKIHLVRHGEVKNPEKIEYLRLPGFFLSDRGIKQSEKLYKYFSKLNISKIYASPLERTRQTAKIISGGEIDIEFTREFLEANYKKWEGLKRDERPQKDIDLFKKNPVKGSENLGESLLDIQKRVVNQILKITKKHKNENIICVFHADPILSAKMYFEGRSLNDIYGESVKHASITTITFNDKLECNGVDYKEVVKAEGWRE